MSLYEIVLQYLASACALALLPSAATAQDCRPLPEILVEALLRGEELQRVLQQPDGSVQVLLSKPQDGSWTLVRVTEGTDVDQACIVARAEP